MIVKSTELQINKRIFTESKAALFYGENDGLKDDFKKEIKKNHSNSEIINLFSDNILKNKNILLNEIINLSLFTKEKIIFIFEADDKLIKIIDECVSLEFENIKIIIFSRLLDTKSKLRNLFEKNKSLLIVPCYSDTEFQLRNYITKELSNIKGLNPEMINLIIYNSSEKRSEIIKEIEKIKLYCENNEIEINKLYDLLNIKENLDFAKIRDAIFIGNTKLVTKYLSETTFVRDDIFYILNIIFKRIELILNLNTLISKNTSITNAIDNYKPRIFWKEKAIIKEQIKCWSKVKIKKALSLTSTLEKYIKTNAHINTDIIFKQFVLEMNLISKSSF